MALTNQQQRLYIIACTEPNREWFYLRLADPDTEPSNRNIEVTVATQGGSFGDPSVVPDDDTWIVVTYPSGVERNLPLKMVDSVMRVRDVLMSRDTYMSRNQDATGEVNERIRLAHAAGNHVIVEDEDGTRWLVQPDGNLGQIG